MRGPGRPCSAEALYIAAAALRVHSAALTPCGCCCCRQCEALLAIMQAGEQVEEAIATHRGDIDATMLQVRCQVAGVGWGWGGRRLLNLSSCGFAT